MTSPSRSRPTWRSPRHGGGSCLHVPALSVTNGARHPRLYSNVMRADDIRRTGDSWWRTRYISACEIVTDCPKSREWWGSSAAGDENLQNVHRMSPHEDAPHTMPQAFLGSRSVSLTGKCRYFCLGFDSTGEWLASMTLSWKISGQHCPLSGSYIAESFEYAMPMWSHAAKHVMWKWHLLTDERMRQNPGVLHSIWSEHWPPTLWCDFIQLRKSCWWVYIPMPGPPGLKRPSGNLNQRYDLQEKPEAVLSPLGIRADMLETDSAPSGVGGNILETVPAQCPVMLSTTLSALERSCWSLPLALPASEETCRRLPLPRPSRHQNGHAGNSTVLPASDWTMDQLEKHRLKHISPGVKVAKLNVNNDFF